MTTSIGWAPRGTRFVGFRVSRALRPLPVHPVRALALRPYSPIAASRSGGRTGSFVTRTPINDTSTVDNMSQAHLYFENGAIGTITSACSLSQGFKTGLDIFARDLVVEFTYGGMKIRTPEDTYEQETGNEMFPAEGRAFIDAVKSGDGSSILCDYGEGLKTLEVTLLAYEAFQKQTVLETTFTPSE